MRRLWVVLLVLVLSPGAAFAQEDDGTLSPALVAEAGKGDAGAQNELAIAYSEGKGVKPNQRRAVYWFRKSAEQGEVLGVCNLGLHYAWGRGVRKNLTEALKWAFVANALDGLKCHPGAFIQEFKVNRCEAVEAWGLAVAWLRAHPHLENLNFGGRPWLEDDGKYNVTLRENSPRVDVPVKSSGKCRPKNKAGRVRAK